MAAVCTAAVMLSQTAAFGQQPAPYPPPYQSPPPGQVPGQTPGQTAPYQAGVLQSPQELQQMVAPIALYPDALIAQVLAASSFPSEIVDANNWLNAHSGLQGAQLAAEVDKQPWDPSIKAMTQFPAVLGNMAKNLSWTSALGAAYTTQAADVSSAIQVMRQRAQSAGNLMSNSQQTVSNQGSNIQIQPANPDVVYVPQYDPWLAYGGPIAPWPGWYAYPGLYFAGPGIGFGLGFGIGFGAGFGWGWPAWGFGWGVGPMFHGGFYGFRGGDFYRGGFAARAGDFGGFRGGFAPRATGMRSGAFGGFGHGGAARMNGFRGAGSFHGGFHGGGGGFHGGGRR